MDETEVRSEIMEMLQYIADSDLPGFKIQESMVPSSTEMSKFPQLVLHHGRTSYRQHKDSWYIVNKSRVVGC